MDRDRVSDVIELSRISSDARTVRSTRNVSTAYSDHRSIEERDETQKGGGIRAWTTLVAAFIVQFSVAGYAYSFGVFQDYYVREFLPSSTSSEVSWIGSTQSFLVLTTGLFAGHLFDKGYFYHLVYCGSLIYALSMFMLSLAKPEGYYQVFLTQAVGVGIGGGLFYTPGIAVLSQHFPSSSTCARAMAIAAAGGSIGGLVQPILLNHLLSPKDSDGDDRVRKAFARGTRANAALVTGLLLIAVSMMRANYPSRDVEGMTPEDREKEGHARKPMKLVPMLHRFASDWPYVLFVIGMTLYEIVFFFPSFYIQLKAIKAGLDPTFAFYSLCILNGVAFFGRAIPGFFIRSLGVANMFLTSVAVATVLIFSMLVVRTTAGVAAFAGFYGFFSGTTASLLTPMLALLAESPAEIGARIGTCFAFSGLGSLMGTPITGALLTSQFIWWRPVIFSGVVCASGFVLFVACRILLGKQKGSSWIV